MAKETSKKSASREFSKEMWITSSIIIGLWIMVVIYTAIGVMGLQLLIYGLPYAVVLFFTWPLMQSRKKSETYKRMMILLNVLAVGSILWVAWSMFYFSQNYTW